MAPLVLAHLVGHLLRHQPRAERRRDPGAHARQHRLGPVLRPVRAGGGGARRHRRAGRRLRMDAAQERSAGCADVGLRHCAGGAGPARGRCGGAVSRGRATAHRRPPPQCAVDGGHGASAVGAGARLLPAAALPGAWARHRGRGAARRLPASGPPSPLVKLGRDRCWCSCWRCTCWAASACCVIENMPWREGQKKLAIGALVDCLHGCPRVSRPRDLRTTHARTAEDRHPDPGLRRRGAVRGAACASGQPGA